MRVTGKLVSIGQGRENREAEIELSLQELGEQMTIDEIDEMVRFFRHFVKLPSPEKPKDTLYPCCYESEKQKKLCPIHGTPSQPEKIEDEIWQIIYGFLSPILPLIKADVYSKSIAQAINELRRRP